jgi:transposase
MPGPPKPRRLDQPIAVSLEAVVPADNFYRHLDAKVELGFVRAWVKECYADRGRPSIDPAIFFKLQLIMFFEGIRSERQLIEIASLNLAHRWYLGYALDEDLPDHSSLTRTRQRLGIDIFQRFFEQVVDLCQEAGSRLGPGALCRCHQGGSERGPRVAGPALLPQGQEPRGGCVR